MTMDNHPVIVAGTAVILTGPALDVVHTALLVAQRNLDRNRLPANRAYGQLAAALHQAMSARPRTDRPKPAGVQADCRWLTTKEAAEQIGCTVRNARRLAPRLDGNRSNGRWLIPEHAIIEHLEGAQTH